MTEVKCWDTPVPAQANLTNIAGVASAEPAAAFLGISELNCVPQGATVANRIGNKIMMKSINFGCTISGTVSTVVSTVRMMLVYDRQPNGAFPAITDVLLSQPAGAATAFTGINIANKSRFLFIRDQFIDIDAGSGLIKTLKWHCKGRWEVEYGANAGTIGDFRTGSLLMIGYVCVAAGAGNISVGSGGQCRIRYYD